MRAQPIRLRDRGQRQPPHLARPAAQASIFARGFAPNFPLKFFLGAPPKIGIVRPGNRKNMAQQPANQAKVGAMIIPVTLFEQNCTLMWSMATKKGVVIDPGGDVPKIQSAIKRAEISVEKIWLTHGHIDHVGGAAELRGGLKVPIEGPHIADKFLLDNVVTSGARFGMTGVRDFTPDRWLEEGDQVSIDEA